jgi:hypothetical protein
MINPELDFPVSQAGTPAQISTSTTPAGVIQDRHQCYRCGSKRKRGLSAHHIVPRIEGGKDDPDNLITLCNKCHGVVALAGYRSLADIAASAEKERTAAQTSKEFQAHDRSETFKRPEWHKWVYGGQRR